jgi:biofilm PGA synthesis N-glycosyltransferase PgaC
MDANSMHGLDVWLVAFPSLLCLYVMTCATLHVLRSEARLANASDDPLPSLAILVAARNEEAVLDSCLRSLLTSDHPRLEIHVLSDGSSDATVQIARGFEGRGVRLHEFIENVGKSRALQAALDTLTTELVMVVDADTLLAPTAASEIASMFNQPAVVGATANIQVSNAHTLLTRLQAVEYASIIGLIKRSNSLWGGLFTVSGAASCFRVQAVREVGGFASPSITEDIELSWRLQHCGGRLVYAPRAIAHVQVPETLGVLWRQRKRWSQGLTEVLRLHGKVWRCYNRALIVFMMESLLCITWVTSVFVALMHDSILCALSDSPPIMQFGFWHTLTITLFACQTATAALLDSHYAPQPLPRLFMALLYPLYFLIIVMPTSLFGWRNGLYSRNTQQWERSERT